MRHRIGLRIVVAILVTSAGIARAQTVAPKDVVPKPLPQQTTSGPPTATPTTITTPGVSLGTANPLSVPPPGTVIPNVPQAVTLQGVSSALVPVTNTTGVASQPSPWDKPSVQTNVFTVAPVIQSNPWTAPSNTPSVNWGTTTQQKYEWK